MQFLGGSKTIPNYKRSSLSTNFNNNYLQQKCKTVPIIVERMKHPNMRTDLEIQELNKKAVESVKRSRDKRLGNGYKTLNVVVPEILHNELLADINDLKSKAKTMTLKQGYEQLKKQKQALEKELTELKSNQGNVKTEDKEQLKIPHAEEIPQSSNKVKKAEGDKVQLTWREFFDANYGVPKDTDYREIRRREMEDAERE